MSAPNGGPAFPVSYGPDGEPGYAEGMTLRAYIATHALVGYLAANDTEERVGAQARQDPSAVAEWAVENADALIAELERSK